MSAWSEKNLEAHFAAQMRLPDGRQLVLVKACMGGVGGVDLVCLDEQANLVLVEVKARRAGRKTIAQLISYLYSAESFTLKSLVEQRSRFAKASAKARDADPETHKLFFKKISSGGLARDFEKAFKKPLKKLGSRKFAYILAPRFYPSTLDIIPWLEQRFPQTKFGAILAKPSVERKSARTASAAVVSFEYSFMKSES